jgi:uncharacterized damage-inducible protein DinB
MQKSYFRRLYAYCDWANERFLDSIRGLDEEQFTRQVTSSFSSVRDTLAHVVFAEWLWLHRWQGKSPAALPDWATQAPFEVLEKTLREVSEERNRFLDNLTDDLERSLDYSNLAGERFRRRMDDLLTHVANHSTYHRGQLVTLLRQVGATPPGTDFTTFTRVIDPE